MVGNLDGVLGPFFLSPAAHALVQSWAAHPVGYEGVLTLCGPIKSGKSALLRQVIPNLVYTSHSKSGGLTPLFIHCSFTETDTPAMAAAKLMATLQTTATEHGLSPFLPTAAGTEVLHLPRVFGKLVLEFHLRGMRPYLCLDEFQVR
jgi:hypothetical protein